MRGRGTVYQLFDCMFRYVKIVTGKIPFEELLRNETVIARVVAGKLPKIREEAQLSNILGLCALMSDCWISDPAGRIGAFNFRRRVHSMVSVLKLDYCVDS